MTSRTTNKFSPEVRERAVRLVLDREGIIGPGGPLPVDRRENRCSAHTPLEWVKRVEIDAGKRAGLPTEMAGS